MVPSDQISSLTRHGHAPYGALRPGAPGASLFGSPAAGFSPAPGSMPCSAPQPSASLPDGTGSSERPFPRLQRLRLATLPFQGQRPWPCSFAPAPASFLARSALLLHRHRRFAPAAAASLLLARCVSACWRRRLLPQPPLPFRDFTPVRIEAFSCFRRPSARLPITPDLRSLPAALSFSRYELWITVPGPLRLRRLAVPQTSWNLHHYDRFRILGQRLL
jgi:hypothetical protein